MINHPQKLKKGSIHNIKGKNPQLKKEEVEFSVKLQNTQLLQKMVATGTWLRYMASKLEYSLDVAQAVKPLHFSGLSCSCFFVGISWFLKWVLLYVFVWVVIPIFWILGRLFRCFCWGDLVGFVCGLSPFVVLTSDYAWGELDCFVSGFLNVLDLSVRK